MEHNIDAADDINFKLNSEPYGLTIEEDLRIEISLVEFPNAIPTFVDVKLKWRECSPTAFVAPQILD